MKTIEMKGLYTSCDLSRLDLDEEAVKAHSHHMLLVQ